MVYNRVMTYTVNGIPVGHEPEDIERNDAYKEFIERIGDSTDNIKIFPDFINDRVITYLMFALTKSKTETFVSQKDDNDQPVNWITQYMAILDIFNVVERVKDKISEEYNTENIKAKENRLSVVKWEKGNSLKLHVDDLGYVTDNHIAALIYLNDDYEGGELRFETHDLSIKPKKGDLVFFPGNMHYAHEVCEVLSGTRYTVPIWFTIP
jgi:Rps23 Pro-64 3,4-dihydroxylase Tpa1-like proline 4-hydroxylase